MSVLKAKPGDIVRIRRLKTNLLVKGRNGHHPEQILGKEVEGQKLGRLRIFTDKEIIAMEAGAGMQMLLQDDEF